MPGNLGACSAGVISNFGIFIERGFNFDLSPETQDQSGQGDQKI
jgi:hypothetical protein